MKDGAYISDLDMEKYIEILEKDDSSEDQNNDNSNNNSESDAMRDAVLAAMESANSSIEVIILGTKTEDLKEQNSIIYQSKNELIKKYAIFGFALFCLILCGLLAFDKLQK